MAEFPITAVEMRKDAFAARRHVHGDVGADLQRKAEEDAASSYWVRRCRDQIERSAENAWVRTDLLIAADNVGAKVHPYYYFLAEALKAQLVAVGFTVKVVARARKEYAGRNSMTVRTLSLRIHW